MKLTSVNLSDNKKDGTEAVLIIVIIIIWTIMMSISTDEHNRIKWFWISFIYNDKNYIKVWQVIKKGIRQFLLKLNLKTLITEYQINNDSTLQFRN